MKKRWFIIVFLIISIGGLIYMIIANRIVNKNNEIIKEYIPEIEISDNELRKTLVTLYFLNDKNELEKENRMIDSKELLGNPYVALVGMLINGPQKNNLKAAIPLGTRIIDAKLNRKCVTVNLSKEFVDNAER